MNQLSESFDHDFHIAYDIVVDALTVIDESTYFSYPVCVDFESAFLTCIYIIQKKKELQLPYKHLAQQIDFVEVVEVFHKINRWHPTATRRIDYNFKKP